MKEATPIDSCQLQFEADKLRVEAGALQDLMYEAELEFVLENQLSLRIANWPESVRLDFDGQMFDFPQAFELSHETSTGLAKRWVH